MQTFGKYFSIQLWLALAIQLFRLNRDSGNQNVLIWWLRYLHAQPTLRIIEMNYEVVLSCVNIWKWKFRPWSKWKRLIWKKYRYPGWDLFNKQFQTSSREMGCLLRFFPSYHLLADLWNKIAQIAINFEKRLSSGTGELPTLKRITKLVNIILKI